MSSKDGADARPDQGGAEPGVAWPDVRGLAAELVAAAEARVDLARRLVAALEVRTESLRQAAALDEMRQRLELRRGRAEEAIVGKRRATEGVERRTEQLQEQIERVLPFFTVLTAAHWQVQEDNEVLSGDKARLGDLQSLLRMRQQCMISKVAALYPVRVFHDLSQAGNHRANTNGDYGTPSRENGTISAKNGNGTYLFSVMKPPQVRQLKYFGWKLANHKPKKSYNDKELQRSAAVLGYAVHAVLLMASYLGVPLRYPLHFGGSRSYVSDFFHSEVTTHVASTEHPNVNCADSRLTSYPLFLECQVDSTTASYALYLLHKDTEQLLNYIGAETSGRNIFGNLRELIRIIQSVRCVLMHMII